nr:hypothetical protein [Tanacetum cinerariifolium]
MIRLEELATAAKFTMMKDQMIVLVEREVDKDLKFEREVDNGLKSEREVDNDLKFENKFRELCEEVNATVKERGEVIEELERLHDEARVTRLEFGARGSVFVGKKD